MTAINKLAARRTRRGLVLVGLACAIVGLAPAMASATHGGAWASGRIQGSSYEYAYMESNSAFMDKAHAKIVNDTAATATDATCNGTGATCPNQYTAHLSSSSGQTMTAYACAADGPHTYYDFAIDSTCSAVFGLGGAVFTRGTHL